jgi:hypothetical protein
MPMLITHAALWLFAAALSIFFAVIAFKHKWYFVGIVDVGIAFISLAYMIFTIINYF